VNEYRRSMNPTIALAIIAKDEVEEVRNICHLYAQYFDKIHVLVDADEEQF